MQILQRQVFAQRRFSPVAPGPYPGVVVIHHMPGWDEGSIEIARRFAGRGYATICPNLHFREGKETPQQSAASVRESGGMPDDRTMGDVKGAIEYLRLLPQHNGKVGVIGYYSGGRQTYLAACTLAGIDAAVGCYGGGAVASQDQLTPARPAYRAEATADGWKQIWDWFGQYLNQRAHPFSD